MKHFFKNLSKLTRAQVEIGPEEIFMDAVNSPGFRQEMAEGRLEAPIGRRPFFIVSAVLLSGLFVFGGRLIQLGVFQGQELKSRSESNRTYPILLAAPRGLILDRNGEKLVENQPAFAVFLETKELKDDAVFREVLGRLENLFHATEDDLAAANGVSADAAARQSLWVWPEKIFIQSGDLRDEVLAIQAAPDSFPGVETEETERRSYPLAEDGLHVIGFVGQPSLDDLRKNPDLRPGDLLGKTGLEAWYDDELRGNPGRKLVEVDARGVLLRERFVEKPSAGAALKLELDSGLQQFSAETLSRHIRALGKRAGALVAIDPQNGAVRALVSYPTFDPNLIGRQDQKDALAKIFKDPARPFFDRVVSGGYPSGSTIKPFLAAAALEERIIDPLREIYDPGYLSLSNPYDPSRPSIFKDWKALGLVDMRRALALSANVYFYTVGGGYGDIKGLGIDRIKSYLERFGWGKPLGIDIAGEYKGLLPDPENKKTIRPQDPVWRIGDTYLTSIGQGDLQVTPLQLAAATAAVANGGTLWKPRLSNAVLDSQGNVTKEFLPQVIRDHIAAPESLQVVREGMRQAVTQGSAAALGDLPFTSAGKTGTAQTGAYGKNHGWFTVFAPYEQPELVVSVLVEEGTGGSTDAVPIAKEVLYYYFTHHRNSPLTAKTRTL